ncbi:MAG TPA: hypothetical protein VGM53_28415 [Streptosporangiaceae bacterium]
MPLQQVDPPDQLSLQGSGPGRAQPARHAAEFPLRPAHRGELSLDAGQLVPGPGRPGMRLGQQLRGRTRGCRPASRGGRGWGRLWRGLRAAPAENLGRDDGRHHRDGAGRYQWFVPGQPAHGGSRACPSAHRGGGWYGTARAGTPGRGRPHRRLDTEPAGSHPVGRAAVIARRATGQLA